MISNARNDAKRRLGPAPEGQTKAEGLSTLFKLTDVTGLTTPGGGTFNRTIKKENAMPGLTRIFAALPGVNAKRDFVPPYNNLAPRKLG